MMQCRNCNSEIKDDAKFCPKCGTRVSVSATKNSQKGNSEQSADADTIKEAKSAEKKRLIATIIICAAAVVIVIILLVSGMPESEKKPMQPNVTPLPSAESSPNAEAALNTEPEQEMAVVEEQTPDVGEVIHIEVKEEYLSSAEGNAAICISVNSSNGAQLENIEISETNLGKIGVIEKLSDKAGCLFVNAEPLPAYSFTVICENSAGAVIEGTIDVQGSEKEIIGKSNGNNKTAIYQDGILTTSSIDLENRETLTFVNNGMDNLFKVEPDLSAANTHFVVNEQHDAGYLDNLNVIGDTLYFVHSIIGQYDIYSLNLETGELTLLYSDSGDGGIDYLLCTNSFIIWTEGDSIYKADTDFANKILIGKFETPYSAMREISYSNGNLYYREHFDNYDSVYEINVESGEHKLVLEIGDPLEIYSAESQDYIQSYGGIDSMLAENGCIFYAHLIEGEYLDIESFHGKYEIRKYDIQTGNTSTLTTVEGPYGNIYIDGEWLYYSSYEDNRYPLKRMSLHNNEQIETLFDEWGDFTYMEGGNELIFGISEYFGEIEFYEILNIETKDITKIEQARDQFAEGI